MPISGPKTAFYQHFSMDAITFIDYFMAIPIGIRAFLLVSGPKRALYEIFSRDANGTKGELKKHLWERANGGTALSSLPHIAWCMLGSGG